MASCWRRAGAALTQCRRRDVAQRQRLRHHPGTAQLPGLATRPLTCLVKFDRTRARVEPCAPMMLEWGSRVHGVRATHLFLGLLLPQVLPPCMLFHLQRFRYAQHSPTRLEMGTIGCPVHVSWLPNAETCSDSWVTPTHSSTVGSPGVVLSCSLCSFCVPLGTTGIPGAARSLISLWPSL